MVRKLAVSKLQSEQAELNTDLVNLMSYLFSVKNNKAGKIILSWRPIFSKADEDDDLESIIQRYFQKDIKRRKIIMTVI